MFVRVRRTDGLQLGRMMVGKTRRVDRENWYVEGEVGNNKRVVLSAVCGQLVRAREGGKQEEGNRSRRVREQLT